MHAGPPNKPVVTTITQNDDNFNITWTITVTEDRPVTGYDIMITGLKEDGSVGGTITLTAGPDDTSITAPYDIEDSRYTMYMVMVCAKNRNEATCSDNKPVQGPLVRDEGGGDNGLSDGATAAIVLVLLILLILLVVFLLGLLWMRNRWRTYPPKDTGG